MLTALVIGAGIAIERRYVSGTIEETYTDGIYTVGTQRGFPLPVLINITHQSGGCRSGCKTGLNFSLKFMVINVLCTAFLVTVGLVLTPYLQTRRQAN